jgi:hypothetical protein
MTRIADRVQQPTPAAVRAARKTAKLTQAEASLMVADVPAARAERTWQNYEADVGKSTHRAIPLATWELFLLLTGQHPALELVQRPAH